MDRIDARKTEELQALLRSAENIVTVSPTHPDGDAVGSSLGMAGWLRSLGKKAVTLFPDPVPETLAFMLDEEDRANCLIHSEFTASAEAALRQADLIFCLDFPSPSRTEGLAEALRQAPAPKVLIDHHPGPEEDAFRLCFSETRISSASELVFWVLDALGAELPLKAATALMTGMTTDTNNFGNSTFPSTFEMASRLLERGVDREGILSAINQSYEERRLRAMGLLLQEMTLTPDGVAGTATLNALNNAAKNVSTSTASTGSSSTTRSGMLSRKTVSACFAEYAFSTLYPMAARYRALISMMCSYRIVL